MAQRRSGRDQDWTDTEAEGLPDLGTPPPGIDAQTASDGTYPPRDHPVGADEAGVTEREEAIPETVQERAKRERPDLPQRPPADPAGRLVDGDVGERQEEPGAIGEWSDDDAGGLSAEEEGVHVRPE